MISNRDRNDSNKQTLGHFAVNVIETNKGTVNDLQRAPIELKKNT
jgi:hypothetical protein